MDPSANRSPRRRGAAQPATAVPLAAPGAQFLFHAALLSAAWAGQQVLAIQMPKMPKFSLPNFGDKDKAKPEPPAPRVPVGDIKVRAASSPRANVEAPTLAEVTGQQPGAATIGGGEGWKRFPGRRMPGANMDPWKEISREIAPKL